MANFWSDSENEAIVKDYFVMLEYEQTGVAFSKADHWRNLMAIIDRTKGAIERKHMNISAAMDTLGLPYIDGYKPNTHLQHALFKAVVSHLNETPDLYDLLTGKSETLNNHTMPSTSEKAIIFDEVPPQQETLEQYLPKSIESIVNKLEPPAERDARNKDLGKAGEWLVFEYERHRLLTIGRKDLSESVRWVARDDGDGYGYDIRSFDGKGDEADLERYMEVKTTNGSRKTPFYITTNELSVSEKWPDAYRVIRLYDFQRQVRAFRLAPPLEKHVSLTPTIFRASF